MAHPDMPRPMNSEGWGAARRPDVVTTPTEVLQLQHAVRSANDLARHVRALLDAAAAIGVEYPLLAASLANFERIMRAPA